ncbi:MAG: hypothetical protein V4496_06850 [Pseudomonadota bacterium]
MLKLTKFKLGALVVAVVLGGSVAYACVGQSNPVKAEEQQQVDSAPQSDTESQKG